MRSEQSEQAREASSPCWNILFLLVVNTSFWCPKLKEMLRGENRCFLPRTVIRQSDSKTSFRQGLLSGENKVARFRLKIILRSTEQWFLSYIINLCDLYNRPSSSKNCRIHSVVARYRFIFMGNCEVALSLHAFLSLDSPTDEIYQE